MHSIVHCYGDKELQIVTPPKSSQHFHAVEDKLFIFIDHFDPFIVTDIDHL